MAQLSVKLIVRCRNFSSKCPQRGFNFPNFELD
uniref:Glucose-6-phosphate 1-dehydrogenase n=1 Tax=Rhizophora mucronata TaxID=61149 RepID=A0A2P2MVS0_RHIMU